MAEKGFDIQDPLVARGVRLNIPPFKTLKETAKGVSFCLASNAKDSSLVLKKTHPYFYQVQHQMYVCNVQWADFIVRTPKQVFIQQVPRDTQFFASVHAKLKAFYFEHLLPAFYAEQWTGKPE